MIESRVTKLTAEKMLISLAGYVKETLKDGRPFSIPDVLKLEIKKIPSIGERKGVPNPFNPGELCDLAAKPARIGIQIHILKPLKDAAGVGPVKDDSNKTKTETSGAPAQASGS